MRVRDIAKVLMLDGIGGGYRNKAENTSLKMEFTVMRTWAIPPSLFLMTLKASRIACKKSFYLLFLYFVIVFVCVCHCYGQTDSLPLQKNKKTTYICTDRKHGSSADSLVSILRRQYDTKTNPLTTDFTFPF